MDQATSRRAVLAGAGAAALAGALAGCATYGAADDGRAAPGGAPPAGAGTTGTAGSAGSAGSAGAAGGTAALAQTADIPVGGGRVFADRKVVVTQPQQGTFRAFTAVCTHQGCTVADVTGGTINCPCHGSRFHAADGSVAHGPATRPLAPVQIAVEGNAIRLGQ
jgi:Rieske Fe-S protein